MQNEVVVNAVLGMTAGAFVLCFIITLFSVVKSMGEGIGELKRPVSHVVRQTSKACLTFALIPIVCILVVRLAGITIASISAYMPNNIEGGSDRQAAQVVTEALSNRTGKPRRGSKQSQIEQAMAASKTAAVNTDTRVCDLIFYLTVKDALRDPDKASYYLSGQHFQNTEATLKSMDVSRVEWLYAFFEVLLVLIIFMKLIIECMTRIFMILILFVVSPYFVSLMPLDDGAKFKRWKEMFVAFTIGVFGPILSMRLYLVLLPYVVTSDSLNLGLAIDNYARFTNEINNLIGYSVEKVGIATQLFRLFFIAAGGYAVYKSQNLMLDLINPEVSRFLAASSTPVDRILMGTAGRVQRGTMKGLKALGLVDKKNSGGGGDQE